jgi:hypothetical protein
MNFIAITGQIDVGNSSPSFVVEFDDVNLNSAVFHTSMSNFQIGVMSTVNIAIGSWGNGFDYTNIVSWSIGGGSIGTIPFRMTLDNLELSSTALSQPSTGSAVPDNGNVLSLIAATASSLALLRRRFSPQKVGVS